MASMRGEEMMAGAERDVLEDVVWNSREGNGEECWEGEVVSGDGLFIPKGWWHSIKSSSSSHDGDQGVIGSVNWWFR